MNLERHGLYILDKMKQGNAEVVKWKKNKGYCFDLEILFKKNDCWTRKNIVIMPHDINNVISVLNNFKLED